MTSKISTRKVYGQALVNLGTKYPNLVVLDAETSNSTFAEKFKEVFPDRFIECFIAEQNMVSLATGLSRMGKLPFVSTFGAFFSRAHDQIRMAQYSLSNIKFVGSHSGVSIGEDGSSQMALEDLGMFRSILNSVVVYPSEEISTLRLAEELAKHTGISYMRTTRADTERIYSDNTDFPLGGSKILRQTNTDKFTLISAGITLFEALKAQEILLKQGINLRVIDLYSLKPIDEQTILKAAKETEALIVVEDHFKEGGLYSAVTEIGNLQAPVYSLSVTKMTRSGKPAELMAFEEIDSQAIVQKVISLSV